MFLIDLFLYTGVYRTSLRRTFTNLDEHLWTVPILVREDSGPVQTPLHSCAEPNWRIKYLQKTCTAIYDGFLPRTPSVRPKSEIYTPKRDDEHPLPFHMQSAPPPRPIHAFRRFTDFIWIEILYFKSCKNTGLVMHKLFCWLKGLCHEDIALKILSGSTNHNNHFAWPNFFKFQIHTHPCGPLQQTTGNQNLLN